MKKAILFFLSIYYFTQSFSQTSENIYNNNKVHYNKIFLQTIFDRAKENINSVEKRILSEKLYADYLIQKNDSLLLKGDISEKDSKEIGIELNQIKKENDSSISNLNSYKKHLINFNSFKKKYNTTNKNIETFCSSSFIKCNSDSIKLKIVEQRLLNSNLGNEKKELKTILNKANEQTEKEVKIIDNLDKTKVKMLQSRTINDTLALKIENKLTGYKKVMDSISIEINDLTKKIASPDEYSKNNEIIKARVILIDSFVNKSSSNREFNFKMIEEGMQKNTKTLFSLAAFFGPGGYIIPIEKYEIASSYFSPVIDSLIKFSNKYEAVPRSATLLVNGYADATLIQKTSKIYPVIQSYLNIENPTKEELNLGLSALRAEELSKLFSKIIKAKSNEFLTLPKIIFTNIEVGRGEQLPDPSISNYKTNDERRRIVIVYWSVLPNE